MMQTCATKLEALKSNCARCEKVQGRAPADVGTLCLLEESSSPINGLSAAAILQTGDPPKHQTNACEMFFAVLIAACAVLRRGTSQDTLDICLDLVEIQGAGSLVRASFPYFSCKAQAHAA